MALSSIKVNLSAFEDKTDKPRADAADSHSIAIVGIGLRLPQADTPQQFARLLRDGTDAIRPYPAARRRDADRYLRCIGKDPAANRYSDAAYLEAIDRFDYAFFKLSPKEASLLDPNQRLFLQAAWHALEDAGIAGDRLRGSRTGVYLGYGSDADYKRMISDVDPASAPLSMPGNVRPIIASRLSYLLDLKGPSLAVDTTCSSSLVAVHLACQALRSGECDTALVGGIQLHLVPVREFEVGVESSTSRTRTFDYDADGTGTGEGAVAIVLKPLAQALEQRDAIYAVIKGSAINQDGSSAGITAPNASAQAAVMEEAWRRAGIAPDTIGYVEAHGTGTKLGDPIEAEGLQQAFRRYTNKRQFCAIGSVKSNLGHLDNAAGITGLVKAVLSLQQHVIYPTLHFIRPNPNIDFIDSPLYVNTELLAWEQAEHPRRCGVSSFGISGTNCHVVLEEAPNMPTANLAAHAAAAITEGAEGTELRPELFALSAESDDALRKLAARMLGWVRAHPSLRLADVCYTLGTGRGHYSHRVAFVCNDREHLLHQLYDYVRGRVVQEKASLDEQSVVLGQSTADGAGEAAKLVDVYIASGKQEHRCLEELGQHYCAGALLPWEKLYRREKRNRLHLPVYPFAETRCWLRFPDASNETASALFHRQVWVKAEQQEHQVAGAAGSLHAQRMLLLMDDEGSDVLANHLRDSGRAVYAYDWEQLRTGGEAVYAQLWKTIREQHIQQVVLIGSSHSTSMSEVQPEQSSVWLAQLERGLYSLQSWFKAMPEETLAENNGQQLELCLIADYAQAVTNEQAVVNPAHAALFGFAKAIRWEHPSIRVRTIDTDGRMDADQLLQELSVSGAAYHVAYREGIRYEAHIDSIAPEGTKRESIHWRTDGIYIMTGGLGGIGLALAKHMAMQAPVKLALLSRSRPPSRKLAQIEELEALGAQVICCEADVADEAVMQALVARLREEHGSIRGVIHAAGISAGNLLTKLEQAELREVMRAKAEGTLVLERAVSEDELDFFMLCSSAITLVGGVGSGPYTAANAFLDAFAARRQTAGKRTLSINWPAWDHTGLSEGDEAEEEKELFRLLPPHEAAACFELALQVQLPQLYVGEWNHGSALFRLGDLLPFQLSPALQQWMQAVQQQPAQQATVTRASNQRPDRLDEQVQLTGGGTEAVYSDIEREVAKAWRSVLGYDELDVHANFFEIGGDSILITNVHAKLEEKYPGVLKVADLFSYPTIAKLASYVREEQRQADTGTARQDSERMPLQLARRQQLRGLLQQLSEQELTVDQAVARYRELEVRV